MVGRCNRKTFTQKETTPIKRYATDDGIVIVVARSFIGQNCRAQSDVKTGEVQKKTYHMKSENRFKPGDMIHVPTELRSRRLNKYVWATSDLEYGESCAATELESSAMIVTLSKNKGDDIAYVLMTNSEQMGWIRLSCCVKKLDECGTDFLHEVGHMKLIQNMREDWRGEDWFGFSLIMALLTMIFGGIIIGIIALHANGKVDSCYVDWHSSMETVPGISSVNGAFIVKGHIPWRSDAMLGSAPSAEEAHELMKKVCPVDVH